ncbi:MAG: SLC13 family permease [Bacteroidales bacterium]|nr:SLC13 family permease [Bacteroidales bacterium]
MITFEGYVVIAVLVFITLTLYNNWIGAGFTFTIGIAVLGVFRILTPVEILGGFANEQIAVVAMLFLLGDIIRKTGVLDGLFRRTFAKIHTYRRFKVRMLFMVAGFSAFLNNTPLVAIMIPYVNAWCKKNNVAPSKLLIPLSYAAILGGTATLIGTSSNLLVAGMVADQKLGVNIEPLQIFDFSFVGVPMLILGVLYLIFFSGRLLPENADVIQNLEQQSREYIAEVRIANGGEFHGKTIEEAGLRNLKGLFLVEILRNDQSIKPVSSYTRLKEHDVLLFAGETQSITEMVESRSGLQLAQIGMYARKTQTAIVEVVISYNSTLVSKTAKEINFRSRFDAAIIAIHRNGERVSGKLGEVKMVAGDVLLLLTGEDFNLMSKDTPEFYIISRLQEFNKQPVYKQVLLIGGIVLSIVASALGFVKLFTALILLLLLIMLTKMVSPKDVVKSIDFNLIVILALSLALGTAMIKSGVASSFAEASFKIFKPFGIVGVLVGIFIITNILTSLLANAAAVAIVFPVALSMAFDLGINAKPFVLIVAFAGAAAFLTPIGYQTNLMVYGPGGYNFKDFMRVGLPLSLLFMVVAVFGLILQYNLRLYD